MKERKCPVCNKVKDSKDMIKITKYYKTGEIIINPDEFHFGRSLYVCRDEKCIKDLLKKDKICKNLRKIITKEEKENIGAVLNDMVVVQH